MTRKIALFEEWPWFKLNNLELKLRTNLTFCTSVAKWLKLKTRKFWWLIPTFVKVTEKKIEEGSFCPPSPLPTPSWIGLMLMNILWKTLLIFLKKFITNTIIAFIWRALMLICYLLTSLWNNNCDNDLFSSNFYSCKLTRNDLYDLLKQQQLNHHLFLTINFATKLTQLEWVHLWFPHCLMLFFVIMKEFG